MDLGKYIHELLLENETVIVPGFGAFVSNYKPAEIDGHEIKPPSKEITFSQKIRNNDGLLVGHIAEKEGLSHFDALKAIKRERENIAFQLDKGEKIDLGEIGLLRSAGDNEIAFEPAPGDNLQLDSFGLGPVSIDEPKSVEDIKEPDEPHETTAGAAAFAAINESNGHETKDPEKPDGPVLEPETPEKQVIHETPTTENQTAGEPDTVQNTEPEKAATDAPEEERKNRSAFWFLLILIPLAVAGYFLMKSQTPSESGIEKNTAEMETSARETNENKPDIAIVDSFANDSAKTIAAIDSIPSATPAPGELAIVGPGTAKFYLVGGSFKEEENAKEYLDELKANGFEPFYMGKRGNFYMVGIGTYDSERAAVRAKRQYMDENPNTGAWVMEDEQLK